MRRVLVTGASRGIGRAIAEALAADWHVLVGGRDPDGVAAVVAQLPSAEPFVCELTDEAAVAAALDGLEQLDALVHSAGVGPLGTVADTSVAAWREVLEVNLIAPANLTRLLLPALRRAQGHVVFLNSGAGFTAHAGWGAYAASKFGLRALADALRAEERGVVRVTSVHPGRTDTDMQREVFAHEGRAYDPSGVLSPAAVADTVRMALDAPPNALIDTLSIRPA